MTTKYPPFASPLGLSRLGTSSRSLFGLGLLLACCAVGDLPWQEQLGTQTRSPMVFVAPLLALPTLLHTRRPLGHLERGWAAYWLFTTAWSLVMLLAYAIDGRDLAQGGRNLIAKAFQAGAENLVFFLAAVAMLHRVRRASIAGLWRLSLLAFLSLCAIAAVEVAAPEVLYPLHSDVSGAKDQVRLALLTSEPSQASPVLAGLFFLVMTVGVAQRKRLVVLSTLLTLFLVAFLLIGSKGGIPILAISALVPLLALLRRDRALGSAIGTLTLVLCAILVSISMLSSGSDVQTNLEDFTSIGTRVVAGASALRSVLTFPLGMGYGTYLAHYPPLLADTAAWLQDLVPVYVNLEEIGLMALTGDNLSAKAGLLTQVVYNGLVAVIFFWWIFRRAWRQSQTLESYPALAFLARTSLIFMLLTLAFGADSNTLYVYLLPLVLLEIAPRLVAAAGVGQPAPSLPPAPNLESLNAKK